MMYSLGNWLTRVSYVLFFAMLGFAAADYGLTRSDSHDRFQVLMAGVFALWLVGCALQARWPRTGAWPWLGAIGLLVIGYGKVALGVFLDHEVENLTTIGIQVIANPESFWAGLAKLVTLDPVASMRAAGTSAAVVAGFLMAIEIWRNRTWSKALLLWMLTIGFSITILFFLQKFLGEPFQLLNVHGRPTSFFVYNYWGNGAAFLNLFWPVALGVCIYCGIQRSRFWSVWFFPPLIIFAAVFFNISKAGNILAVGGVVWFLALVLWPVVRMLREFTITIRKSYLLAVLIPTLVIGVSCYFAIPWERWDYYLSRTDGVEDDTRYKAYVQFVRMIPDAGWTGFGAGTFDGLHRDYLQGHPELLRTPFWTAHQDYIQTLAEWGWAGTAMWAWIMIPGSIAVFIGIFRRVQFPSIPRRHYGWGAWDPVRQFFLALPDTDQPILLAGVATSLAMVAVHAAVDFPFQVPSLGLYFLVWVAMGWSLMGQRRRSDHEDDYDS